MTLLGAHVSVAGGLDKAFSRGRDIGCDALQIFVKNPSQWQAPTLSESTLTAFHTAHEQNPMPVIAHSSYLINLCSSKPETLERSRRALAAELVVCGQLGVLGLVLHPGAHLGRGEAAGLEEISRSLDLVLSEVPNIPTKILLENTAGQGTVLGYTFSQLARIIELVDEPDRLGICFDSCHAFASGYPLHTKDGYQKVFDEIDREVGISKLEACHLNDSKAELGTRKDRHENIGKGQIGTPFFARLIHDERFSDTPMILETPLGDDENGHAADLTTLRGLEPA
ncbi:MAG: deoxyribonuclease IV [Trueperaceae bacterium]|nr:MAG: deoxyribonuclease IV [Trueperaceae bacterium]